MYVGGGRPPQHVISFLYSLLGDEDWLFSLVLFFLFTLFPSFVWRVRRRKKRCPTMIGDPDPGQEINGHV